jgi:hypothetical protein
MKVKGIKLTSKGCKTTVELTEREAALIARMIGPTNHRQRDEIQSDGGEVGSDIWDALTGEVFNRFYEAGIDGVPR